MSSVELWKASQAAAIKKLPSSLVCGIFVVCVEICCAASSCHIKRPNFSSWFNKISPACSPVFHKAFSTGIQQFDTPDCGAGQDAGKTKGPKPIRAFGKFDLLPGKNLLEGVHQTSDGAVQVLIGSAHFFDLVDGVQHSSVVLTAELTADFGQ